MLRLHVIVLSCSMYSYWTMPFIFHQIQIQDFSAWNPCVSVGNGFEVSANYCIFVLCCDALFIFYLWLKYVGKYKGGSSWLKTIANSATLYLFSNESSLETQIRSLHVFTIKLSDRTDYRLLLDAFSNHSTTPLLRLDDSQR